MKFSMWLTGAVGPQAVAGRHSSTRLLSGVTLNFYPPLRNEPVLFSTLKNEPKQLNNDPFH